MLPDDYVSAEDRDESYVAKVEKAVEEEQKEAKEEK